MTDVEFSDLLRNGEDDWLDWKRDFPSELAGGSRSKPWEVGKGTLLKDIAALANGTGRSEAYLVMGVQDHRSHREVVGISQSWDDADMQTWARQAFEPPISFRYEEFEVQGKKVGVFQIQRVQPYPHVAVITLGPLHEGQVWTRTSSQNRVGHYPELRTMFVGDRPIIYSSFGDPEVKEFEAAIRSLRREPSFPEAKQREAYLRRGYEAFHPPGTRQEVWVGNDPRTGQHILMLKPAT